MVFGFPHPVFRGNFRKHPTSSFCFLCPSHLTPLTKSNQNAPLWYQTSFGFLFFFFTMDGVEMQNFVSLNCERGRYLSIFIFSFISKHTFNSLTNIQFSNWHWQELCGWKWGSSWPIVSWGTPGPAGPSIPLKPSYRDFVSLLSEVAATISPHRKSKSSGNCVLC